MRCHTILSVSEILLTKMLSQRKCDELHFTNLLLPIITEPKVSLPNLTVVFIILVF